MTFKQDIEREAGDEPIEAIVIGAFGWSGYDELEPDLKAWGFIATKHKQVPNELKHKVQKWDDIKDFLDYNYDRDYGSPNCHAITAWTKSKVIAVGTYDGSTWVYSIPRNPTDHKPIMEGGG